MAAGKETPRQKMIGMMYLVLTALLALNVSQQILKGFITVDENIGHSKAILTENNEKMRAVFEDYVNQGNIEAKPYLLRAIEAQQLARKVNLYIDSVKFRVIRETEDIAKADTAQLRYMKSLDNFDVPTYVMIGSDETHPKTTPYSANHLRKRLAGLHSDLTSMLREMQKDKKTVIDVKELAALEQKMNAIKPVDRNITDEGVVMNWELENFYNLPLAAVITNLDKMQADVKTVEAELIHVFSAAGTRSETRTKSLVAKVFAPSPYVQTGQPFRADIMLAAGSTDIPADRMKVLVGAELDANGKPKGGSTVPIELGIGKYEATATGQGPQDLKGVVVYRNTKGEEEYYPFTYPYMVAAPFSAVAADNMNVFYVGVDNPISVSAAGFAPSELVVTATGCGATLKPTSAGKYELQATSAGTCMVTISARTAEGLKVQGAPKAFRVKVIPTPIGKVLNRFALSTLELSRQEMASIGGISAESMGFQFPVNTPVVSYHLELKGADGSIKPFDISGPNLSAGAKQAISQMKPGNKVWIENIKVRMPGKSTPVDIPNITLKLR